MTATVTKRPPLTLAVLPSGRARGRVTTWHPHPGDRELAEAVLLVHRRTEGTVVLDFLAAEPGANHYDYQIL